MDKELEVSPSFDGKLKSCPLCQSGRIRYCDRDYTGITIDKCVDCGIRFMNPQYSDEFQGSLYDGYIDTGDISSLEDIWESAHLNSHQFHFQKIEEFIPPGKILAFGCGNGRELQVALERNWQAEGYDVDPECVSCLSQKHGVPIHTGDFFHLDFESDSFDCIYLDQVLEHLKVPAPYLKEFFRLLKPGGILFLAVPNIESIASRWKTLLGRLRLKRRRGKHYDTWHHLFYFCPRSLSRLLGRRFGFETLATGNDVFMMPGLSRLRQLLLRTFTKLTYVWRSTFYLVVRKPESKLKSQAGDR